MTARVYATIHRRDQDEDAWHRHTTRQIRRFLEKHFPATGCTLDIGSGKISYVPVTARLDLVIEAFIGAPGVVADLGLLPIRQESIDAVFCVGSVLNYVPLSEAVGEIARVLRPGGVFVLEYERLHGRGLIRPDLVKYQGEEHVIWLYADEYLDEVLGAAGFTAPERDVFHVITPLLRYAVGVLSRIDAVAARFSLGRAIAANAIVRTQKRARPQPA